MFQEQINGSQIFIVMPRKTGKLRECDSKATPDNGKFSQGPAVAEAGRHRTKDPFWKQHLRNSNAAGKPVIPAHATSGPPTRAAEALGAGGGGVEPRCVQ